MNDNKPDRIQRALDAKLMEDSVHALFQKIGIDSHTEDKERHIKAVEKYLGIIKALSPEDVDCGIMILKVKNKDNSYRIVGGFAGWPLELDALEMLIAARLEAVRCVNEEANENRKH